MCGQGGEEPLIRQGHGMATTKYYQVDTLQVITMPTKAFAHNAFYTVTINRPPRTLLRDRKPQARRAPITVPGKNREAGIDRSYCRLRKQIPKIPRSPQPCSTRKACIGGRFPSSRSFKSISVHVPWHDASSVPCVRYGWTCVHESHVSGHALAGLAERFFSCFDSKKHTSY